MTPPWTMPLARPIRVTGGQNSCPISPSNGLPGNTTVPDIKAQSRERLAVGLLLGVMHIMSLGLRAALGSRILPVVFITIPARVLAWGQPTNHIRTLQFLSSR